MKMPPKSATTFTTLHPMFCFVFHCVLLNRQKSQKALSRLRKAARPPAPAAAKKNLSRRQQPNHHHLLKRQHGVPGQAIATVARTLRNDPLLPQVLQSRGQNLPRVAAAPVARDYTLQDRHHHHLKQKRQDRRLLAEGGQRTVVVACCRTRRAVRAEARKSRNRMVRTRTCNWD